MAKYFPRTSNKLSFLLLSIVLVNIFVVVSCPNFIVPPPLATQRGKVVENLIVCCIPLIWTVFIIFWLRSRFALVIGLINLVPAIIWLVYALPLVVEAF